jgi:hypothetical protein
MSGQIRIRKRSIPERQAWAIAGLIGVLVPVVPGPMATLIWLFPALGLVLIAGLGAFTWRIRRGADADTVRRWVVVSWIVFIGPLVALITYALYPPGAGLPEGWVGLVTFAVGTVLVAGGSVALAVAAYEVGHRRLWNGVA